MAQLRPALLLLVLLFSGPRVASASRNFNIVNNCSFTVWPGTLSNAGMTTLWQGGSILAPRAIFTYIAPTSWAGRIWGRTACSFDAAGAGVCETGDCGRGLYCDGAGGIPPATLAEFTLDGFASQDFYDVSLVDGYNLPLVIQASGGQNGTCGSPGCVSDLNKSCPSELQVVLNGTVVACKSACEEFQTDRYCCSGAYNSPTLCGPTNYSEIFKDACPTAYSYAYDDNTSTFTCQGPSDYTITFCPGGASGASSPPPVALIPPPPLMQSPPPPAMDGSPPPPVFSQSPPPPIVDGSPPPPVVSQSPPPPVATIPPPPLMQSPPPPAMDGSPPPPVFSQSPPPPIVDGSPPPPVVSQSPPPPVATIPPPPPGIQGIPPPPVLGQSPPPPTTTGPSPLMQSPPPPPGMEGSPPPPVLTPSPPPTGTGLVPPPPVTPPPVLAQSPPPPTIIPPSPLMQSPPPAGLEESPPPLVLTPLSQNNGESPATPRGGLNRSPSTSAADSSFSFLSQLSFFLVAAAVTIAVG